MSFPILKAIRWGRFFSGLNTAGMAGRSVSNINSAYTGLRQTLKRGDGKVPYLHPKQRYDVVTLMEGAEIDHKKNRSGFDLVQVLNAMDQVPGMQLMISVHVPKRRFWHTKEYKNNEIIKTPSSS